MSKMTDYEANSKIAELVKKAYEAIKEAEQIADEYNTGFGFSLAYGMGGYYEPKKKEDEEWENSGCSDEEEGSGWRASSQSC